MSEPKYIALKQLIRGPIRNDALPPELLDKIKAIFDVIGPYIRFHLHAIEGVLENEEYGDVGLRLMNEMWRVVKGAEIPTTGINHWVYMPGGKMFVVVALRNPQPVPVPDELQPLDFEFPRYLKHFHIGSYQVLLKKWKDLQAELARRGEIVGSPSLEVYGHHCDDEAKQETTIFIGLQAKRGA